MKGITLVLLPICLLFITASPVHADEFFVSNSDSIDYPQSNLVSYDTNLSFEGPIPAPNTRGECSLIDNSTNTVVDANENIYTVETNGSVRVITNILKGDVPSGWTDQTLYHLECLTTDNISYTSNDFSFLKNPQVIHVDQNNNLIDVYLASSITPLAPENPTDISLRASNWFDFLGYGICEDNVMYQSQLVTKCHFDLLNNPNLPSTNNAYFAVSGAYGVFFSGDQFHITQYDPNASNDPELTSLAPAKIWVAKGLLNLGLKLDFLVEAYTGHTVVSSGQLNSVTLSDLSLASLQTIPFNSF